MAHGANVLRACVKLLRRVARRFGPLVRINMGLIGRWRGAVRLPCKAVQHVGQGRMDVRHVRRDQTTEGEVQKHGGNGQKEAAAGGDKRFSDALGKVCGLRFPRGQRAKAADHSRHRSEQTNHGRQNGECVEVVHDGHHFCLRPETFVGNGVFHGGFVVHIPVVIGLGQGAYKGLGEWAWVALAAAVGFLEIPEGEQGVEFLDQRGRKHFGFSKGHSAEHGQCEDRHRAEGDEVHDGTSIPVEVKQALI